MAKRTVMTRVDDLDGTELADGEGQTVTFSVGSAAYEIDLSDENLGRLYDALQPFTDKARRVGSRRSANGSSSGAGTGTTAAAKAGARTDREQVQAVRDWAKAQGLEVNNRGRVSKKVLDAYHEAHQS